jgi:actin-related protein
LERLLSTPICYKKTASTSGKDLVAQFETKEDVEKWLRSQNKKLNGVVQELYKIKEQINILDTDITATGEGQQAQQQQQQPQPPSGTKSKRSAATKQRQKAKIAAQIHEGEDETFGMSDNDWSLYSSIDDANIELLKSSKEFNKNRSELVKQQQELEQQLAIYTREIQLVEQELYGSQKSAPPTFFLDQYYDDHSNGVYMDVAVERVRVPEILFSPSMIGMESAGLGELIQVVLECYPRDKQLELVKNVYLSGGNTRFEGFKERIEAEIRQIMPVGTEINVKSEPDILSSWKGSAQFAQDHKGDERCWITKKQYDEMGGDYLLEHSCSNLFLQKGIKDSENGEEDEDDE